MSPFEIMIEGVPFSSVNMHLQIAIKAYLQLVRDQDNRSSGYFTIMSETDGRLIILAQIGECKVEKFAKYSALSVEKAQRLFNNKAKHWSSYESRDPAVKPYGLWGGAIRTRKLIFSFSGLCEKGDESVMLMTAYLLGLLTPGETEAIAGISGNLLFRQIFELIDG